MSNLEKEQKRIKDVSYFIKKMNWMILGRWLAMFSSFVFVLSQFLPYVPPLRFSMLDYSWMQALHVAFSRHLQFGRDIVFTSGPWGFLLGGFYPNTFTLSVIVWTILSIIFWCTAWQMACQFSKNALLSWFWMIGFTWLVSLSLIGRLDALVIAWNLLLLFLRFFVEDAHAPITGRQVFMTLALGLLSLTRFTSLVETVVVVVALAVDDIFRRRRFPWIALLFTMSVLIFWIMAGQKIALFGAFLRDSFYLTDGYTEAMLWDQAGGAFGAGCFVLAAVTLIMLVTVQAFKLQGIWGMIPVASLSAILFFIFKHGYVRYDDAHENAAITELALGIMAYLAVLVPTLRARKNWTYVINFFLMTGALWFFFDNTESISKITKININILQHRPSNLKGLLTAAKSVRDSESLQKFYYQDLADIRSKYPIPPIEGTVDVYPCNQIVIFAYGLHYHPRPVIQSYSAYTPELEELNAAYLRNDNAASNLLFDVEPIDNHFPSLEDGLSWPELLTRYNIENMTTNFIFMKRVSVPRKYRLTPLADIPIYFNQSVTIPVTNSEPIWAEIEINKSLLGAIRSTFYKPPILGLTVSLRNGEHFYYRLIPGMARSGFLLSPLIKDKKSFVALASNKGGPDLASLEVASILISAATKSRSTICYQSPMRLRCFRFDFPRQDLTLPEMEKELH